MDAFGMTPVWGGAPGPGNQRQFSNRSDASDSESSLLQAFNAVT